jgi:predicted TIM-barrel enzyme
LLQVEKATITMASNTKEVNQIIVNAIDKVLVKVKQTPYTDWAAIRGIDALYMLKQELQKQIHD